MSHQSLPHGNGEGRKCSHRKNITLRIPVTADRYSSIDLCIGPFYFLVKIMVLLLQAKFFRCSKRDVFDLGVFDWLEIENYLLKPWVKQS
jgi:hypothetical protein